MTVVLRKIIGLGIAGLLTLCVTAGGVWAYLTDTENSTTNALVAGTIDMVPSVGATNYHNLTPGGNTSNGFVEFTKMRLGSSGTITWTLYNQGSLAGTLTINAAVTGSDVSQNEVESAVAGNNGGGDGDLDTYLGVKLQRGVGTDQSNAEANFTYILGNASNFVPLSGLEAALDAESQVMAAGGSSDTIVYKLSWSLAAPLKGAGSDGYFGTADDTSANPNIIQSDTTQINVTFTLTQ